MWSLNMKKKFPWDTQKKYTYFDKLLLVFVYQSIKKNTDYTCVMY